MTKGPQTFELFPFVLHHFNRFRADAATGLGVIRLEVDDLHLPAVSDHGLDQLHLVGIGKPFLGLLILKPSQELDHSKVHKNVVFLDGLRQDNALETGAAAQGHIDLAMGKGAPTDINNHLIKGLSLALMNGNGPGQLEGVLGEGAHGLGKDFLGLGIVGVFIDLPIEGRDIDDKISREFHLDDIVFPGLTEDLDDFADRAVDPPAIRIIIEEHDLGTRLHFQFSSRGKG